MDVLPSIIKMQDSENQNLVWITETIGGQKIERTEETTETVTSSNIFDVNDNEQIITEMITRTVVKKKLSTLNNATTN